MTTHTALVETLAISMFNADHGPSGISWDSMADFIQEEWRDRARRVCDGLARPGFRVVLDFYRDEITWEAGGEIPHQGCRPKSGYHEACDHYMGNVCGGFGGETYCDLCGHDLVEHPDQLQRWQGKTLE